MVKIFYDNGVKVDINDVVSTMSVDNMVYSVELLDEQTLTMIVTNDSISVNMDNVLLDKSLYEHFFNTNEGDNLAILTAIDDASANLFSQIDTKINSLIGEKQFQSFDGLNGSYPDGTEILVNGLSGIYTVGASFPLYNDLQNFMNCYEVLKDGKKTIVPAPLIRAIDETQTITQGE